MKAPFTVARMLDLMRDTLQLDVVTTAESGLDRVITTNEVSSPGLVLAGFVERFPAKRMQVFGETEMTYLASLSADKQGHVLELFFSFDVPCAVVTKGIRVPARMIEIADSHGICVLSSPLKTTEFYRRVKPALDEEFAPTTTLHGSLADVYGVGLLFVGKSGIGKSECVLDLVERGHRLVADDLVIATRRGNDVIIGRGHELQRHHMEIRGVGLIDIPSIFGVRSVRQQKRIEVVVRLEHWEHADSADRTGLDGATTKILDVEIPRVTIPLNPGKNITVVAEVIAMNHLLRFSGIDPAEAFNQRLIGRMRAAADVRQYLAEDDE
ncbi:MAG TPA: HPr(Ser) kinase/phosphatase [Gemmatimonadaceae bacterium]|jgi:HPr kinase/phosphorylase|nr:HPr(Ser) kinase/phosphatase [Gemmatimonadaceae bacterium]